MSSAEEGDLEFIPDFFLARLLWREEEESEDTEEDEEEGDGEGLLFLLCFFPVLSRFDKRDLECFFLYFLDLCRFLSLSLEEEEEERREEEVEVEECFLFLCDFFFPLEREGERL